MNIRDTTYMYERVFSVSNWNYPASLASVGDWVWEVSGTEFEFRCKWIQLRLSGYQSGFESTVCVCVSFLKWAIYCMNVYMEFIIYLSFKCTYKLLMRACSPMFTPDCVYNVCFHFCDWNTNDLTILLANHKLHVLISLRYLPSFLCWIQRHLTNSFTGFFCIWQCLARCFQSWDTIFVCVVLESV